MLEGIRRSDVRSVVSGLSIELLERGEGPTLVFLHPGDGFDPEGPFLTELSKAFRVIAPSHPGFGDSELPRHFRSVSDLAYFYLDFLEERDLKDVLLVGVCFGGWIATEIAVRNASRLSGLVLADAVGFKWGAPTQREIADLFGTPLQDLGSLLYADPQRARYDFTALPIEALQRATRNRESFTLFGWSPTLYDANLKHWLHRIKTPTLVLWGDQDKVVSTQYGRSLAETIADARFEIIEGAGHYPHVERPQEFAKMIRAFAGSLQKRQATKNGA